MGASLFLIGYFKEKSDKISTVISQFLMQLCRVTAYVVRECLC